MLFQIKPYKTPYPLPNQLKLECTLFRQSNKSLLEGQGKEIKSYSYILFGTLSFLVFVTMLFNVTITYLKRFHSSNTFP